MLLLRHGGVARNVGHLTRQSKMALSLAPRQYAPAGPTGQKPDNIVTKRGIVFEEVDDPSDFPAPSQPEISLIGRMGRDIQAKDVKGFLLQTTTLAVNESSPDQRGDHQRAQWFDLELWGPDWQGASDQFRKGSWSAVAGKLTVQRRWTKAHGITQGLRLRVQVTNLGHVVSKRADHTRTDSDHDEEH